MDRTPSEQIGHSDSQFTLRVYTPAVNRHQRLEGAELEQFNRAVEWAQWARMGTNDATTPSGGAVVVALEDRKAAA